MMIDLESRVKVSDFANEHYGRIGVVVDVLESRKGGTLFEVQFPNEAEPCDTLFTADALEKIVVADPTISFKIDIAENTVIAIMIRDERQIARGHGHIIHDGAIGIAQAASYACKKLYESMNGGSMIGGEYRGR